MNTRLLGLLVLLNAALSFLFAWGGIWGAMDTPQDSLDVAWAISLAVVCSLTGLALARAGTLAVWRVTLPYPRVVGAIIIMHGVLLLYAFDPRNVYLLYNDLPANRIFAVLQVVYGVAIASIIGGLLWLGSLLLTRRLPIGAR